MQQPSGWWSICCLPDVVAAWNTNLSQNCLYTFLSPVDFIQLSNFIITFQVLDITFECLQLVLKVFWFLHVSELFPLKESLHLVPGDRHEVVAEGGGVGDVGGGEVGHTEVCRVLGEHTGDSQVTVVIKLLSWVI